MVKKPSEEMKRLHRQIFWTIFWPIIALWVVSIIPLILMNTEAFNK